MQNADLAAPFQTKVAYFAAQRAERPVEARIVQIHARTSRGDRDPGRQHGDIRATA